jgi:hypothetical protein
MTGLKSSFIPVADSADEVFTSCGWIKQKFGMFRLESRQDDQDWVLTGQHKVLPI